MKTQSQPIPELLLEQLALGEIAPADERWLSAQLEPAELERRLAALREADKSYRARHDETEMLTAIAGRTRIAQAQRATHARSKSSLRFWLPSLAAAACALLWVARPVIQESEGVGTQHEKPELIYVKGLTPHLVLYRRLGERADILSEGARATRGDMLQVGYVAATAKHGVIVSIDGAAAVTLHFPDAASAPTLLEDKGEHLLQHAYELDAAPAFERFFFVTSEEPIDVTQVLDAARALSRAPARARRGALTLAPGLSQHSLTLLKE